MMTALLNRRVTLTWVALIVATLISAWVGIDYAAGAARAVTVVLMIIAFIKINLIGRDFMELRDAPRLLWRSSKAGASLPAPPLSSRSLPSKAVARVPAAGKRR
jgi:hypothetical protein